MTGTEPTSKRRGDCYEIAPIQRCPRCGSDAAVSRIDSKESYSLWCWHCRKWFKLADEPKRPPAIDSWTIAINAAGVPQVRTILAACEAAGVKAKAIRGTVDIAYYKERAKRDTEPSSTDLL